MRTTFEITTALRDEATRRAAFDRLTGEYLRPLYWHVRRLVVSHEEAEDVVQETFVRAYDRIGAFRGGDGELRAWLYSIATRAALSALRRRRRSIFVSLDAVSRELAGAVAEAAGPDADEGLPSAEIARILGQREESLKVNYHHAVTKLKEKLKTETI